jgi:uncharacterized membrane protein HdeD (DUF308 family)
MSLVDAIRERASTARWFGILLVVLGVLAIATPLVAGLSVAMAIGALLIVSGVAQLFLSFRGGSVGAAIGIALLGVLAIVCGGYMLVQPGAALAALTLFLAALFFAQGLIEVINGFGARPESGWGWLVASGVVSVLLAVMIWAQFPLSGAWAVGTLVGVRLLMSGIVLIAIGSAARQATKTAAGYVSPGQQDWRGAALRAPRRIVRLVAAVLLVFGAVTAKAQQFNTDNQWVAPHGVATLVPTVGEEYAQMYFTAALIPEWEFNAQFTHYYDDPRLDSDDYTVTNLYAKHRLSQNEAETQGYALMFGTGLFPGHLAENQVTRAFENYWANAIATYGWNDDQFLLDIMPGVLYNDDLDGTGEGAWGFTWSSRLAIYDIIPETAIVGEVFGTEGDAESPATYRFGLRYETEKWILSATYSDAFDGSQGAGFELGLMYFTEPRFCLPRCR